MEHVERIAVCGGGLRGAPHDAGIPTFPGAVIPEDGEHPTHQASGRHGIDLVQRRAQDVARLRVMTCEQQMLQCPPRHIPRRRRRALACERLEDAPGLAAATRGREGLGQPQAQRVPRDLLGPRQAQDHLEEEGDPAWTLAFRVGRGGRQHGPAREVTGTLEVHRGPADVDRPEAIADVTSRFAFVACELPREATVQSLHLAVREPR